MKRKISCDMADTMAAIPLLVRGDWRRQVNRSEERSEQTAIPHRSTEPHS